MSASFLTNTLPRLVYVGDVAVESSYHGSALLFRLLQDYPPDKLIVVEAEPQRSLPERRLPGVPYRKLSMGANRWRNTRFSRWAGSWLTLNVSAKTRRLRRCFDGFHPDAVLTVAHGYSWLAAARFAEDAGLPLHLIVHDDWLATMSVIPWLTPRLDRRFGHIYRQAASRLCVSPYMEDEYRHSYGAAGQVLYPSRAKDTPAFDQAPRTYSKKIGPLVGGYAGSIASNGYARLIQGLAECLQVRGGKLMLFGPHSPEALKSHGLDGPNIVPQGLIASEKLIPRLRNEVDFLFVPMMFDRDGSERNMRISFPSKLTDYTAAGLPLLICGPDYCSAARWARQYAPVAESITSERLEDVDAAVHRLEDRPYREHLGRAAAALGERLFSHRSGLKTFYGVLLTGSPSDARGDSIGLARLST
jgi:hypothetical protein